MQAHLSTLEMMLVLPLFPTLLFVSCNLPLSFLLYSWSVLDKFEIHHLQSNDLVLTWLKMEMCCCRRQSQQKISALFQDGSSQACCSYFPNCQQHCHECSWGQCKMLQVWSHQEQNTRHQPQNDLTTSHNKIMTARFHLLLPQCNTSSRPLFCIHH